MGQQLAATSGCPSAPPGPRPCDPAGSCVLGACRQATRCPPPNAGGRAEVDELQGPSQSCQDKEFCPSPLREKAWGQARGVGSGLR